MGLGLFSATLWGGVIFLIGDDLIILIYAYTISCNCEFPRKLVY